jgi:hypothetical protein
MGRMRQDAISRLGYGRYGRLREPVANRGEAGEEERDLASSAGHATMLGHAVRLRSPLCLH